MNDCEYNMHIQNAINDLTGSYFMRNVPKKCKDAIQQAARETGFDVHVEDVAFYGTGLRVLKGSISVFTREPGRNHTPFWDRFEEIKPK